MATKIGLRDVANLQPNQILWDATVRGFCVRRQRSETITFSVFYRSKDQVQRWHKIGRFPVLTPHIARQEAIRILRSVALGEDPSAERMALRRSHHSMEYAMTLASNNSDRLLSPKEAIEYIHTRYGVNISLASFYSMISRGDSPKVTYFRNRPKFTIADIDEWVR